MKCYWAGCEHTGEREYKGGLLCEDHYIRVINTPAPDGEVIGRQPEPYLGEFDKEDWDMTRDLKIPVGYKLLKRY